MNFFDEDPMSLPRDGQYYFNILVRTIAVNPSLAKKIFPEKIDEICFIGDITQPRPCVTYTFIDDELDDDIEFEIECHPHCVVEISQSLGVSWWDMLDFDTNEPWRIEG